jgi:hypothetical protein
MAFIIGQKAFSNSDGTTIDHRSKFFSKNLILRILRSFCETFFTEILGKFVWIAHGWFIQNLFEVHTEVLIIICY